MINSFFKVSGVSIQIQVKSAALNLFQYIQNNQNNQKQLQIKMKLLYFGPGNLKNIYFKVGINAWEQSLRLSSSLSLPWSGCAIVDEVAHRQQQNLSVASLLRLPFFNSLSNHVLSFNFAQIQRRRLSSSLEAG